jgi:apolipoprotein N-acyltransferase
MFSWIITLSGLGLSWHFTDLESGIFLQNVVCPILVGLFLIIALVKASTHLSSGRSSGDSGGFFDGFGGDGGCGGD